MYSTYPPPHAGDVLVPLPPQQKNVHPSRRHPAALRDNLVAAHRNDVANASAADHHCATKISATWRGYITRKRLATRHITRSYQYLKAVKIQCFVRCAFARRAAGYLREQREEICRARNDALIAQRVNELKGAVKWQAALFEASALKIQTIFRWKYAKRRKSIVVTNTGELKIIEEDVTPVLPKRQYMPQYWRRRSTVVLRSAQQKALEITENPSPRNRGPLNGSTEENTPIEKMILSPAPPRSVPPQQQQQREFASAGDRALPCLVGSPASLPTGAMSTQQLVLYDNPQATGREVAILSPQPPAHKRFGGPPTQATVEAINERNRRRDQELSELIESEQQQLRIRDRIDGIVQADLDHCAAVLQRRFRVAAAKQNLHSRQCLSEYLNRYAIIIQCAFRSFISRLHASQHRRDISTDIYMASQKYGMTQVERLKQEFVWNASIMTKAARTIQTGFRRFRYLAQYDADSGVAYEDYIRKGPPALPLGLMKDVPEHRTSTQSTNHSDDVAVQKYVFRRHKRPAARKALAEDKARAAAAAAIEVASAASSDDETDAPTTPAAEEQSSSYAPVASPPMAVLPDDAEARYPDVLDDEQPVNQEPVDPQTEAATRIQSCFRQHSARANVAARKEQRDAAFEKLLAEEAAKNLINNSQRRASGETGDTPEEVPVTGAAPPSAALAADSSTTPANSSDAVVDAYAVPDSDHAAAQPDSNDADTTAPTNAPAEPHDDVVVASEVAADLPPTKDDVAPVAEHSPQAETDQ